MSAAFELIDGVPNYNLYVGGKWVRSSRNEAAESRNPATGELFAKVHQAGRDQSFPLERYASPGPRFSMEEMTELKWITIQSGQRAFPM